MDENQIRRIQPHSEEAEAMVIGSMIMDNEVIPVVENIVRGADFYHRQYGMIYDAMVELYEEGKPVDLLTLQNRLKEKDVPPEVVEAFVEKIVASKDGFEWYLRFGGDPNDPLKCSFDGKRREKATLNIAGNIFPAVHRSDAGRDQREEISV